MSFKSTPRQPRRHGRAGTAGHLRGNENPGLQLLVQRLARKRLARDRDPPVLLSLLSATQWPVRRQTDGYLLSLLRYQ